MYIYTYTHTHIHTHTYTYSFTCILAHALVCLFLRYIYFNSSTPET